MPEFIVTERAQRPVRMDGTCFYCGREIGKPHKADCVLIHRRVRIKMEVVYDINVPADMSKHDIEYHRNCGSWCANNAIEELSETFEGDDADGCMCGSSRFEVISMSDATFLDE